MWLPMLAGAEETTLDAHLRDLTAAERISATATVSLAVLGIALHAAGCASLFVWMVRESVGKSRSDDARRDGRERGAASSRAQSC